MNVNLQVAPDGKGNWEDFGEAAEEDADVAETAPGEAGSGEFDVSGIAVTNAALTYTDATTGDRIEVSDLNFTTGAITSDAGGSITVDGVDLGAVVSGVMDVR